MDIVEVRLFLKFKRFLPENESGGRFTMSVEHGSTVEDIRGMLGIPDDEPGTFVLNGINIGFEKNLLLNNGDVVSFFSPASGG